MSTKMPKLTYEFLVWIRDTATLDPDPENLTERNARRFVDATPRGHIARKDRMNFLVRVTEGITAVRPVTAPIVSRELDPCTDSDIGAFCSAADTRSKKARKPAARKRRVAALRTGPAGAR